MRGVSLSVMALLLSTQLSTESSIREEALPQDGNFFDSGFSRFSLYLIIISVVFGIS